MSCRPAAGLRAAAWTGLLLLAGCAGISEAQKKRADAHYQMATAYLQQGAGIRDEVNRRAAFPELSEAIRLDPENAVYHQILGAIYLYNREYPHAEAETKLALRLNPNLADAHNNLGTVYIAQGRFAEAAREFQAALNNLSYTTPEIAYFNLGNADFQLGDFSGAVEAYERSLAILPGNPEAQYLLGMSHVRLGRLADAEKALTVAAQMRPEDPRTHYELGMVLFKLGRKEQAAQRFGRVVELDPSGDLGEQSKTYLKLLR